MRDGFFRRLDTHTHVKEHRVSEDLWLLRDERCVVRHSRHPVREQRSIAKHLNCQPSELFFTSGGTEADNLACHIAVQELGVKRIISTSIEHHAVGHTVEMYRDRFKVELHNLSLDDQGHIDLMELEALLKEPIPTLVSFLQPSFSEKRSGYWLFLFCKGFLWSFFSNLVDTSCLLI